MPDNYTDGTLEFGSFVISVTNAAGGGAFSVILDNISPSHPVKKVTRTNEVDEPAAFRLYKDFETASAQAQLDGSNIIKPFATFTEDFGEGEADYVIGTVGEAYVKDGEKKQNIEIHKKIN